MLEQFLHHIKTNNLFLPDDRILLAVSGGIDSIVMLRLFQQAGFTVAVAHCNFQLRAAESDGDAKFVQDICTALGVSFFSTRFETQAYAEENKLSIQMAARELRYTWFNELLEQHNFNYLATAHHLQDSIETSLMNWINGASLDGLTGIPVKHNRIIRPLLFATRDAIELYARENNITWREDSSNQTTNYVRNHIRKLVIPELKKINSSLERTVSRGIRKLKGEATFAEMGRLAWERKFVSKVEGRVVIQKSAFENLGDGAAGALFKSIKTYGFNFDVCEDVVVALHTQSGKKFLGPSHQLVIDREELIITAHEGVLDDAIIAQGQMQAVRGPWKIDIELLAAIRKSDNPTEATLDFDKLTFPLLWRKWTAGDYFYPLGMEHKKKLSDFLVDSKIPVSDKDFVSVLVSAGEIAWVVGHRIDNRFKITNPTKQVISFTLRPYFV